MRRMAIIFFYIAVIALIGGLCMLYESRQPGETSADVQDAVINRQAEDIARLEADAAVQSDTIQRQLEASDARNCNLSPVDPDQ